MKKIVLVALSLLSLGGAVIEAAEGDRTIEEQGKTQIILGQKLQNPYAVENMREAFRQFNSATKKSHYQKYSIQASHQYIKISPVTEEHLIALEKIDAEGVLVLHDMPLDYEIVQEGDYFINPEDESDLFHPVYTVMPMSYKLPPNLLYTILEEVYEPSEQEFEVEAIALKSAGWDDEIRCADGRDICDQGGPKSSVSIDLGSPSKLESKGLFSRRYRPHGYVKIRNTENNQLEPLRKARISIGRGIWWRYTHTDDNGHFTSPKKYRGKVRIRAKWRSDIATIRKSWNELLGIQVSDHMMTLTRGSNGRTMNIELDNEHLWYKGTVHNGLVKYNDFAAQSGINKPIHNANIWVWKNGKGSASAPMLYKYRHLASIARIAGIGQSDLWDVLVNNVAAFAINIIPSRLQPDMIFTGLKRRNRTTGSVNTAEIEQVVFHESGHYSHATQAGAWSWAKLFSSELSNNLLRGDSYGDGSEPSFTAAKQISLFEGWATVVEHKAMDNLYGKSIDGGEWILDTESHIDNFDMFTVPYAYTRTTQESWFLHGLLWDVVDLPESKRSNYRNGSNNSLINRIDNTFANFDIGSKFEFAAYMNQ